MSKETIFFCNHDDDLINVLCLIAKQYIFARKCLGRFELSIATYKQKLMEIIAIERSHALSTKRYKPFVRKWKRLFNL